jgi:hypothetical protein
MKSFEVDKKQILNKEEKEKFFLQLENDKVFFKEAFEAMLTLVISDPVLTNQVADLIESDYHNLYLEIAKKQESVESEDLPGCCQIPKN